MVDGFYGADPAAMDGRQAALLTAEIASATSRLGIARVRALPVIDNARHIMIFVAGAGKAEIVRQILTEGPRTVPYPVQMIRPTGMFEWYLDDDAAQALPEAQP